MCWNSVTSRLAFVKRLVSIPLWFYTGWTAGALIEYLGVMTGLAIGPALGPILGITATMLSAGGPRRLIWSRTAAREDRTAPVATGQPIQHPI